MTALTDMLDVDKLLMVEELLPSEDPQVVCSKGGQATPEQGVRRDFAGAAASTSEAVERSARLTSPGARAKTSRKKAPKLSTVTQCEIGKRIRILAEPPLAAPAWVAPVTEPSE